LAVIQTIRIALWTMMKLHDPKTVATASLSYVPASGKQPPGAQPCPEAEVSGALV
jgi:hypothetical protein